MARVTVEDCIDKVPNRFKLVILAVQRAKELSSGHMVTIERNNDKNPVVALREIAEQTVNLDELEENIIRGMQKNVLVEDGEEDLESILAQDHAVLEGGESVALDQMEDAEGFTIDGDEANVDEADEDAA
jgi:DNA-directed RNA polymerase subunit omega